MKRDPVVLGFILLTIYVAIMLPSWWAYVVEPTTAIQV